MESADNLDLVVAELINRRQYQLVIHSIIYYEFNDNVIDDATYDLWSKELAELLLLYPHIAQKATLAKMFEDFDGSTGYQLVSRANKYQRGVADRLLRNHKIRNY